MSKERELLKRVLEADDDGNAEFYINGKLEWDIKELLAQPEQEPVAWMHIDGDSCCIDNTKLYGGVDKEYSVPLYTSPPKPEGLTPRQGLAEYKRGYNAAVRDLKRKVDSVFNLVME